MQQDTRQFVTRTRAAAAALLVMLAVGCGDDGSGGGGPGPVLPVPTGLTVNQTSLTSANVSWTAVTGATSYLLQRADATSPGVFQQIGGGITATNYADIGLTQGLVYSYRVAAVNSTDTSGFSANINFATGIAQTTISSNITANRTLFTDTTYVLQGYVKVQNGVTLTIQPGTKIVGDTATFGSSLWILRGAQLNAQGTAIAPIVFTSQRSAGNRRPGDWGGIIMVGNGIINRTGTILTEGPAGVAENYGGGSNNADNSGTLRYVRIEFAGFDVSGGGNSELNGLSMYAIGSGTTIEYVQTVGGLDDSFEWWGGAVDGRYLVSYEAGDDHFDWSEGYIGRNQFLIGLQVSRLQPAPGTGLLASDPQGFEADGCNGSGCASGFRSTPYSDPIFANFAMIGSGAVEVQPSGGIGAVLRRGTKGLLYNGIIARWKGQGLTVRDSVTGNILVADSLNAVNLIFAENTAGDYDQTGTNFGQATNFTADNHRVAPSAASLFLSLNPVGLDWTPPAGALSATGGGTVPLPAGGIINFFGGTMPNTTYVGPADPAGTKWWQGWTVYLVN